ncbi:YciI family protein [Amycolatopsis pigmentata]|uniref:YciI family protein n=1 Tax=Amycolatopsis pigmentata TaxID=450801 RepID=A0ABW5FR46_9PSEU
MRFMVQVRATEDTEAGVPPSAELIREMTRYNEELAKAGVLLDGVGLLPSSRGARVRFSGRNVTVVDGPFAETKELIAGYWVIEVASKEEAVEWARRVPNPGGDDFEIEVRQIAQFDEFGEEPTPEQGDRPRA